MTDNPFPPIPIRAAELVQITNDLEELDVYQARKILLRLIAEVWRFRAKLRYQARRIRDLADASVSVSDELGTARNEIAEHLRFRERALEEMGRSLQFLERADKAIQAAERLMPCGHKLADLTGGDGLVTVCRKCEEDLERSPPTDASDAHQQRDDDGSLYTRISDVASFVERLGDLIELGSFTGVLGIDDEKTWADGSLLFKLLISDTTEQLRLRIDAWPTDTTCAECDQEAEPGFMHCGRHIFEVAPPETWEPFWNAVADFIENAPKEELCMETIRESYMIRREFMVCAAAALTSARR